MSLFGVIAAGLTLIGATTYFVATRDIRKKRSSQAQDLGEEDGEDDLLDYMSDDDDLNYRLSTDRKRKAM